MIPSSLHPLFQLPLCSSKMVAVPLKYCRNPGLCWFLPEINEQSSHMASKRVSMTTLLQAPNQEENASGSHCATSKYPPCRLHDASQ